MNPETKNRKLLWLVGAALVVLYFAPSGIQWFRVARAYRQHAEAINARAQTGRSASDNSANPALASPSGVTPGSRSLAPAATSRLIGMWVNSQAQASGELCTVNLEIRDKGEAQVNGYAKLLCYPTMAYFAKRHEPVNPQTVLMKELNPIAAILSGSVKDGAVAFNVDKVVGTQADGCGLTALTVTPFGSDEIAVEWQRGACDPGQMTLTRQGR